MSEVRDAVADNVRKVLVFAGLALILLGGALPVPPPLLAVPGIVCLFAALLVAEPIAAAIRADDERTHAGDPLEELRERYARGEIDHDEFERRVERLVETEGVPTTREDLEVDARRERELE